MSMQQIRRLYSLVEGLIGWLSVVHKWLRRHDRAIPGPKTANFTMPRQLYGVSKIPRHHTPVPCILSFLPQLAILSCCTFRRPASHQFCRAECLLTNISLTALVLGDVVDTSITFLARYVQQHGSYDKWSTLCSHFGAPPGVHGPRSGGRTCQPLGAGDVPLHNAAQIT